MTTAPRSPSGGSGIRGVRKVRRGPLTRKQILDASLHLFSQRGFARTSVRDIAEAAGITDAAIYYHFASKRELFDSGLLASRLDGSVQRRLLREGRPSLVVPTRIGPRTIPVAYAPYAAPIPRATSWWPCRS